MILACSESPGPLDAVTATQLLAPFTVEVILQGVWQEHLIPGIMESPGNIGLRQAGFSKHWRMPEGREQK